MLDSWKESAEGETEEIAIPTGRTPFGAGVTTVGLFYCSLMEPATSARHAHYYTPPDSRAGKPDVLAGIPASPEASDKRIAEADASPERTSAVLGAMGPRNIRNIPQEIANGRPSRRAG